MAVIGELRTEQPYDRRSDSDFCIEWFSGSVGAGGQNHQKTQNCARVTHVPTGLMRIAQTRSRQNSLKAAMTAINHDLDRLATTRANAAENHLRRQQVGSGERSDKRRTYRFQDGLVHDHITGKSSTVSRIMNGCLDLLWPAT